MSVDQDDEYYEDDYEQEKDKSLRDLWVIEPSFCSCQDLKPELETLKSSGTVIDNEEREEEEEELDT